MDDRWLVLTRVRDLRARLALNEVSGRRQTQARAQSSLEEASRRRAQYDELAAQASALLAARSDQGGADFTAAQAQELLSYAAGARLKAQEAQAPIRRARLQCERAQIAADEAAANYRRETGRQEAVYSQWRASLRTAQYLRLEREDQTRAEEQAGSSVALRLAAADYPAAHDRAGDYCAGDE